MWHPGLVKDMDVTLSGILDHGARLILLELPPAVAISMGFYFFARRRAWWALTGLVSIV